MTFKSCVAIILLCCLSACVSVPEPSTSHADNWLTDTRQFSNPKLAALIEDGWHYAGKVSVATESMREQASLDWHYHDQSNQMRLFGPLGVGAVKLNYDRYGVMLSDNKGVVHRGDSAEQLLSDIIGWPIPVNALSSWIFVIPSASNPFRYQVDNQGRVTVIEQLGWRIEYRDYREFSGFFMPSKIFASKLADAANKVEVRLVTRNWDW